MKDMKIKLPPPRKAGGKKKSVRDHMMELHMSRKGH